MCHVDTEQLDDEDELLYMPSKQLKESEISEIASKIAALAMEEQEIVLSDVVTKNSLPVLTDDICLFPGSEPIVRVEEAPSNARRIFTGVDIMADMESIWEVLTAFEKLQDVVPSLVQNEVQFHFLLPTPTLSLYILAPLYS